MSVKRLLEELNEIPQLGEDPRRVFEKEIEEIINTKFEAVRLELWEKTKAFKEANPGYTTVDLPNANRNIDTLALAAGTLIDILDDKAVDKGTAKKIRKALGYNG